MEKAAARLLISGRVQGVFYRASTQDEAQALKLSGWVRNLPAGQVEVLAEGPREKIEALVAWCKKGPPMARVSSVDVKWCEPEEVRDFHLRY